MPTIQMPINAKVLYAMYEYAAWAKYHYASEIAGWGHYKADEGIYKLAPLTKQIVSGAEVDAFPTSILNDTEYDISDMTMQWHSHVDMGVSPSGVDKTNIEDTLKLMPMLVSIIVNCKNQYSARLDIKRAGSSSSFIVLKDAITFDVELIPYYVDAVIMKEVKQKLRKYVPKPVIIPATPVIHTPPTRYDDWRAHADWRDSVKKASKDDWKTRMVDDGWTQDLNGEWTYKEPAKQKVVVEDIFPEFKESERKHEYTLEEIYTDIGIILTELYDAHSKDFVYSEVKNGMGLSHCKSGIHVYVGRKTGVFVNGEKSHWADFIDKISVFNKSYKDYYYPLTRL